MSGVWHAAPSDPDTLARFDTAQDGLARSLQRLMIVVEGVPDLRATEPFRGLRTQLEGAENTIAAERMRFNEASRAFNTARNRFSAVVMTGFFGSRFAAKPYFRAAARAEIAPAVQR